MGTSSAGTALNARNLTPRTQRDWLTLGLLTAIAALIAVGGGALFRATAIETAAWPVSGFFFALVFLSDGRMAPAAIAGGVLALLVAPGWDPAVLGIPIMGAAEALAARALLRRVAIDPGEALRRSRAASGVLLTTVLVTALGGAAQLGMALVSGRASASNGWALLQLQIASDMVGALYTLTLVYGWREPRRRDATAGSAGEAAFVVAVFVLCAVFGFLLPWNRLGVTTPSLILVVPIGIWAAMRLGARVPTSAAATLAILATFGALRGLGAFAAPDRGPAQREFLVLMYLLTMIITILVLVSTVTEREATARREEETRRRLQFILDNTTDGILLFRDDADGTARCIEINQQTAHHFFGGDADLARWSLLGRTRGEVAADLLEGAPNEGAEVRIQAAIHTGETAHHTMARRTDRGMREFDVSMSPIRDPDGVVRNVIVSIRDVTDRTRAVDALRDSEMRLATIYDNVSDCLSLWVVDADQNTQLVSVNRATYQALRSDDAGTPAEALSGWRMDLALGNRLVTLGVHDEQQHAALLAHHDARLREVLTTGRPVRYDESVRLRDGVHALEVELVPITGQGDAVAYVLRSARDVTDRMRAEEARRTLEAGLRQSQKLEAIGTLAGGIAHDFNNILAGILGNVELARADLDPHHPASGSLREVLGAIQRARDVVRQILTFSRAGEGQRRAVRIATVVQEVLPLLRATMPATTALVTELQDDDATVLADAVQLHQVLMNLCTNAAQAIGDNPGEIVVSLGTAALDAAAAARLGAPSAGDYAMLTVSDDGPGMEASVLERIFEPFFTTKPPGEGTGLGLPVVHGIVRSHGGAIRVSSRPGAGTRVEVCLPLTAAPVEAAAADRSPDERGTGQHILLVDDEEAITRAASRLLERHGFRVTAFQRAREAAEALRDPARHFDLILSDLTMPELSGIDLARRALECRPDVPFILATGFGGSRLIEGRSLPNVAGVIDKPFERAMLTRTILAALRRDATGGAARPRHPRS